MFDEASGKKQMNQENPNKYSKEFKMNSILKTIAMSLLVLFLVGCQSSEVPPAPDSPGGVAGEYSVATDELGDWANPSVTLTITPDRPEVGINEEFTISIEDTFIWNQFYVYSFNEQEWQDSEQLTNIENTYKESGWIQDSVSLSIDEVWEDSIGDYIIASYSCTRENNAWNCHGGWQVEGLTVEAGIPNAPGAIGEINDPGTFVTNDESSEQEPSLIQRANEDLVIVYNKGGQDNNLASSISSDYGKTWTEYTDIENGWDDISLIEVDDELVLLAILDGISTTSSNDGMNWGGIADVTPTVSNDAVGSIYFDGEYYYATYDHKIEELNTDVFVTRSNDLESWSDPIQITSEPGFNFDSSMTKVDGEYIIAAVSYNQGAIVYSTSTDGVNWSKTSIAMNVNVHAHGGLKVIDVDGTATMFYTSQGRLQYSELNNGVWSEPETLMKGLSFGADPINLYGEIAVAYTYIAEDGQRDIAYKTLSLN